ncbi:hypothetical protein LZC34_09860, partial [Campylobacter jejuni]
MAHGFRDSVAPRHPPDGNATGCDVSQNSSSASAPQPRSAAGSAGRLIRKTAVDLVVDALRDRILSG